MRKLKIAILLALFASLALASDHVFSPPPATHAKTYPLFEAHDDEKVSIAIDLYDEPPKAAVFKAKYRENGFLVLRLIISNDDAKTLMLDDLKVEYITGHRTKLEPASADDIFRRFAHPGARGGRSPVPLPIPVPRKQRPAVSKDIIEEVDAAQFRTVPVTARSTNSGFLFFDVLDVDDPKLGAHVYISGIKSGTKELFYFDLPLEKVTDDRMAK